MPLIASLIRAYAENRIEERLKFCCQPRLLIIDETGYIPIDRQGAHFSSSISPGIMKEER